MKYFTFSTFSAQSCFYMKYCLATKNEALSYWFKRLEIVFFFFCRLVLKCRSKARKQFAALRSDVLVKLELLDNKHFQDMVFQLKRLLDGLAKFHIHSQDIVSQEKLFPIECDFAPSLEEATNGPEETGFDWFMIMWAKLSIPSTLNTECIVMGLFSFPFQVLSLEIQSNLTLKIRIKV